MTTVVPICRQGHQIDTDGRQSAANPCRRERTLNEMICVHADERADFVAAIHSRFVGAFPQYLNHCRVISEHWRALYDLFPDYQFALMDKWQETPVVLGNCFPLQWNAPLDELPEEGIEWALSTAVAQAETGSTTNLLCAFQIVVSETVRGRGLSTIAVRTMIDVARQHGLASLIAPVRPNRKSNYPQMPMEQYLQLRRADGQVVDDWLRVHLHLGGRIVRICHRSMTVEGSLEDWQKWTGIRFSQSGEHLLPGGIVPVECQIERDHCIYVEPNVWVEHRVQPSAARKD